MLVHQFCPTFKGSFLGACLSDTIGHLDVWTQYFGGIKLYRTKITFESKYFLTPIFVDLNVHALKGFLGPLDFLTKVFETKFFY